MKTEERKQTALEKRLALLLTLQSAIHQMDDLSHEDEYRHLFKQRTENYYSFLDKSLDTFISHLNDKSGSAKEIKALEHTKETYVKMVAKFDKIAKSVKIS